MAKKRTTITIAYDVPKDFEESPNETLETSTLNATVSALRALLGAKEGDDPLDDTSFKLDVAVKVDNI